MQRLQVPGRELKGIHFAMEYPTARNGQCESDNVDVIGSTERFSGTEDERVARLRAIQVDTKTTVDFDADLVLPAPVT